MEIWHLLVAIIYLALATYTIKNIIKAHKDYQNDREVNISAISAFTIAMTLAGICIGIIQLIIWIASSIDFSWLHYKLL